MTEKQVGVCRIFYDHCRGIVGVCSDDPMKACAGLVARGAQGPFLQDAAEGFGILEQLVHSQTADLAHTAESPLSLFLLRASDDVSEAYLLQTVS